MLGLLQMHIQFKQNRDESQKIDTYLSIKIFNF